MLGKQYILLFYFTDNPIAREFMLYVDFENSDGSITAWELLCVEVVDYVCTHAYMKFYLI